MAVRFTQETARFYHEKFNSEIEAIAKKYGFSFEAGKGRFSDQSFTISFTIKSIAEGESYTAEDIHWADIHYSYLLPKGVSHVLGSKWRDLSSGKTFILEKIASRGKYIFWMKNITTGDILRYSYQGVKNLKLLC